MGTVKTKRESVVDALHLSVATNFNTVLSCIKDVARVASLRTAISHQNLSTYQANKASPLTLSPEASVFA